MKPLSLLLSLLFFSSLATAQLDFERPPIDYHNRPTNNPIEELQKKLDSGEVQLKYDEQKGYLPHLMELLGIHKNTQTLVFSKTSLQLRRIMPERPRALYFNDDTYLGYVQYGDVVEISTTDPELGAMFYTLDQQPNEKPQFVRDRGHCYQCHASNRTKGVPGHLVRSVYSNKHGQPEFGRGTYTTDHSTPFSKRFGGWYVTGKHGDMRHMGNTLLESVKDLELDREAGANITDLSPIVDTDPYLTNTSDIVALMVLQHQTQMHNYITLANLETISALNYNQVMSAALERPDDYISGSTKRRIRNAAEKLVKFMLFSEEFALESPVSGTSGFSEEFSKRGPRDSKGRSLFQLDLQTRLLKFPCSWLIYTESFDKLPPLAFEAVANELYYALTYNTNNPDLAHLSRTDKQNIYEILTETKPNLVKVWKELQASEVSEP
jgi:hypothetical protein